VPYCFRDTTGQYHVSEIHQDRTKRHACSLEHVLNMLRTKTIGT